MLLTDETVAHYRRAVTEGANRVAARLSEIDAPFTGVPPSELESTIAAIDLDAPLLDLDRREAVRLP